MSEEQTTETEGMLDPSSLMGGRYADVMEDDSLIFNDVKPQEQTQEQDTETAEEPETDDTEEEVEEVPQHEEPSETTEAEEEESEESESEEEAKEDEPKLTALKYKGKTIEVSAEELKNLAEKGLGYTRKSQRLSEEAKMGVRLQSALEDPDAAKALLEELAKKHGSEDLFDFATKMDEQEGKFDFDKKIQDAEDKNKLKEAFNGIDVDNDDFTKIMGRISGELKDFLPEDVYNGFVSDPKDLRIIHDLIEDGTYDETKHLMQAHINKLSDADYNAVSSDPARYAQEYAKVIEKWAHDNGLASQESDTPDQKPTTTTKADAKDSAQKKPKKFSGGTRNSNQAKSDESDWDDATDDQVELMLRKLKGLPV